MAIYQFHLFPCLYFNTGTGLLYLFVKEKLGVVFNDGDETLDISLETMYDAIKNGRFDEIVLDLANMTIECQE